MGGLPGTLAAAVGVFVGTNVDDIIVLTVLFLSARAIGRPRPWQIWVGQYAGIGVLVAVSAAAAVGLSVVPDGWIGLLGLVPLVLGVKGLVSAGRLSTTLMSNGIEPQDVQRALRHANPHHLGDLRALAAQEGPATRVPAIPACPSGEDDFRDAVVAEGSWSR